jgi:hypothetical protein
MILHGDGKANIIKGDCFKKIDEVKKFKPTIGLLNPPYSTSVNELKFLLNNLEALEKNGYMIAILPMSCALYQKGEGLELKQKLLKLHTLEAVLSMPDDLFYPIGTNTCIMIFKAHQPHQEGYKTYFGYWKDDGFIKKKHQGRIETARWNTLKKKWLKLYINKENEVGFSIKKEIKVEDEWLAEVYIEKNYNILTKDNFVKTIKNYVTYLFANEINEYANNQSIDKINLDLQNQHWIDFKCGDLFNIKLGKPVHKEQLFDGNLPYITRTANNNGVECFGNSEFTNTKNAITIGAEGVIAFYQMQDFITGNKINIIEHEKLNKYNAMFVCTILNYVNIGRFSYGYAIVQHRLKNLTIKLPATQQGEPDWEFMENYVKSLPYSGSL